MPYLQSQTISFVWKNGEFPIATVGKQIQIMLSFFNERLDNM